MLLPRRHFLHRMGLASAAPIVHSIGNSLVSRAMGATPTRRIAIFLCIGETIPIGGPNGYLPTTFAGADDVKRGDNSESYGSNQGAITTWPSMFEALSPFSSRMLVVDGLKQTVFNAGNHGNGYAAFSGVQPLDNINAGEARVPGAQSLDQYAARTIGKSAPVDSLLFGFQGGSMRDTYSSTFAAAAERPVAHTGRPTLLLEKIVGKQGTATVPGGADNAALLERRLVDLVRGDIKRLGGGLAGEERAQLDGYLAALEEHDSRRHQLRTTLASGSCQGATPTEGTVAQRLESLFNIATVGLRCGVTNVLGVTLGNGHEHDDNKLFSNIGPGIGPYGGHSENEAQAAWQHAFTRLVLGHVGRMLRDLGPLIEQTLFIMTPANGVIFGGHHGKPRTPFFLLDGAARLRTGAHYVRYSSRGTPPNVYDLFTTLTHAIGHPVARFNERGKGPIPELLAT